MMNIIEDNSKDNLSHVKPLDVFQYWNDGDPKKGLGMVINDNITGYRMLALNTIPDKKYPDCRQTKGSDNHNELVEGFTNDSGDSARELIINFQNHFDHVERMRHTTLHVGR